MIHSEGLTVEVCGEQGLGMAGRRQVERHKIWVRIPRGVKIDRRLHPLPIWPATSVGRREAGHRIVDQPTTQPHSSLRRKPAS